MQAVLSYKLDAESKDDFQLALLELKSLSKVEPRSVTYSDVRQILGCEKPPFIRSEQLTFVLEVTPELAGRLLRRLAFWDFMLIRHERGISPEHFSTGNAWALIEGVLAFATQSQVMEWTAYAKDDHAMINAMRSGHALEALAELGRPYISAAIKSPLTPVSRRKNEYLTHGFHKYKAKFFPRLARSLINVTCPNDDAIVLDPYCGSGTTGVEASLMGMKAVEFDLDPLSAFIAHSKVLLGHLDFEKFQSAVSRLPKKLSAANAEPLLVEKSYQLPRFLLDKNPKKLPPDVVNEIEREAGTIKQLMASCADDETRALFELSFSHALATKVGLRWMGTGDNRFALEIGSRSLYAVFLAQLLYMVRKLETWAAIRDGGLVTHYGEIEVGVSDCTKLPIAASSVDAVVTSPPYLPAASGRETYLRSRAASLIGLGLMSEEEIHQCELQIVGSILAVPENKKPLPESVVDLVSWMLPQRERTSKARPTTAYFEKLAQSLVEMKRVLRPGGSIALVVSKEHMFYEMSTRRVLRTFDMVKAISELATEDRFGIGLELDRVQILELPKMDFAARPGSHGTYCEAILFLRKPTQLMKRVAPSAKSTIAA